MEKQYMRWPDRKNRINNSMKRKGAADMAERKTVIVVGAGAAGLMAAITAARCGAKVTLLEAMDRPGKSCF